MGGAIERFGCSANCTRLRLTASAMTADGSADRGADSSWPRPRAVAFRRQPCSGRSPLIPNNGLATGHKTGSKVNADAADERRDLRRYQQSAAISVHLRHLRQL